MMSPINFQNALKNICKKLWYWNGVICKWVNFSFKCFLSNVGEVNLLLFFKKKKAVNLLLPHLKVLCYLMAKNQLKCDVIYEKKSWCGWVNMNGSLILNNFHTLFCCFHLWLGTIKVMTLISRLKVTHKHYTKFNIKHHQKVKLANKMQT